MESQFSNKEVTHALAALSPAKKGELLESIRANLLAGDYRIIADSIGLKSISSISDVLYGRRKSKRVLAAAYEHAMRNKKTLAEMGREIARGG